jgi:hypothetical protein
MVHLCSTLSLLKLFAVADELLASTKFVLQLFTLAKELLKILPTSVWQLFAWAVGLLSSINFQLFVQAKESFHSIISMCHLFAEVGNCSKV